EPAFLIDLRITVRKVNLVADRCDQSCAIGQSATLDLNLPADNTGSVRDDYAQVEHVFARFELKPLLNFPAVFLNAQDRQAVQDFIISFQVDKRFTRTQSFKFKTSVRQDVGDTGNPDS